MTEATIIAKDAVIRVQSKFEHAERCRSVMGGTWNPDMRVWEWPATSRFAAKIREAFTGIGSVKVNKEFLDLAAAGQPQPHAYSGPDPLVPLWSHQSHAVALAAPHEGFYFAHDMGAGKTLSAIALILKRGHTKTLVFAPKRVILGWGEQIERYAGGMLTAVPLSKGRVEKRIQQADAAYDSGRPVVIIINYEALVNAQFREWAYAHAWDLVVADEAHRIKSPNGVQSQAMATLGRRAKFRLCMSGTPIPHNPLDVYAQYRFLDPSVFGTSYTRFRAKYAIMGGFEGKQIVGYRDLDDLQKRFYSIADRVMTADVVDLPEHRDEVIEVELTGAAMKVYKSIADEFYAEVEGGEITVANALTKLLRLQQITSGSVPQDDGEVVNLDQTKEDTLGDLLSDLPPEEPVVVFAVFRNDLAAIRRAALAAGRTVGEISGSHDDYEAFREGKVNTVAVQLQAGGEGLNDLVRARYCVYYSVGFSLARYNQSRARIVRPGQRRNVIYYHLVAKDTVDVSVYRALAARMEVVESILKGEV